MHKQLFASKQNNFVTVIYRISIAQYRISILTGRFPIAIQDQIYNPCKLMVILLPIKHFSQFTFQNKYYSFVSMTDVPTNLCILRFINQNKYQNMVSDGLALHTRIALCLATAAPGIGSGPRDPAQDKRVFKSMDGIS